MDDFESCTPPEIQNAAKNVESETLLPQKSKELYQKIYSSYKYWCLGKNVTKTSENVLLVYFQEKARNQKASSLWAKYSMLKTTISLNENIDISKFYKIIAFLKRQNTSYTPKKSCVFSKDEITKFLADAPNETYLSTKAIFVIGLAGACRTDELHNMLMKDIDIRDDIIIVNIPHSKNGSSRKFVIVEPNWMEIVKSYLNKRPFPDMPKVFIGFRNGKPTKQNIGHNTISKVPNIIAKYLHLPNAENYTGHSLRRTSATILAESGGDILSLKRHGGWKSGAIAEGYIEESIADKKRIAQMVQGSSQPSIVPIIASNQIPSSSSCSNPMLEIRNEVINNPVTTSRTIGGSNNTFPNSGTVDNEASTSMSGSASLNSGISTPAVNMSCHNCTINFYYK